MDQQFKAIQAIENCNGIDINIKNLNIDDLYSGDVLIKILYSTINYKDGLAIEGNKGRIMRKFPIVPGIDFAGIVLESSHRNFVSGDEVIATGWGLGETHSGGLSQMAKVKGDWLIKKPQGITLKNSMSLGTAGLTAMLCVLEFESNFIKPKDGPVLVTGASGGVGSASILLLSNLGYEVIALTRGVENTQYLNSLGASQIIYTNSLDNEDKLLSTAKWSALIDTVGGSILSNLIPSIKQRGCVAVCGNTAGVNFTTNVLPFILRGIRLVGIDSNYCSVEKRKIAWNRLSNNINNEKLELITKQVGLKDVFSMAKEILLGNIQGRIVVDVNHI